MKLYPAIPLALLLLTRGAFAQTPAPAPAVVPASPTVAASPVVVSPALPDLPLTTSAAWDNAAPAPGSAATLTVIFTNTAPPLLTRPVRTFGATLAVPYTSAAQPGAFTTILTVPTLTSGGGLVGTVKTVTPPPLVFPSWLVPRPSPAYAVAPDPTSGGYAVTVPPFDLAGGQSLTAAITVRVLGQ